MYIIANGPKYLLILPCSKRKRVVSEGRAVDVYDGPFIRVVRKEAVGELHILILSAKYGLIDQDYYISNYDQIMTSSRALTLQEETAHRLQVYLDRNNFKQIYINVGKTYALALEGAKSVLDRHQVIWGSGEIGERLHQLKRWLRSLKGEGSIDN